MRKATTPTKVIVPLDGGEVAERAIPVATAMAGRARLPITLVTVCSEGDLEGNATAYLEARSAELPKGAASYEVLWGMPAVDAMVDYLHGQPDALVCCSTHARVDANTFRLGSVAEELVRRSPVPVVLVGPRAALPGPGDRYEDAVICVEDESAYRVFPCVRDLSATLDLQPSLLQVTEPSYGGGRAEDSPQLVVLRGLCLEFAEDGIEAECEIIEDRNVPLAIATFARRRSSPFLALSSRRRYPEERYEESSVTVAIARIASCPVLVVGPAVAARFQWAERLPCATVIE